MIFALGLVLHAAAPAPGSVKATEEQCAVALQAATSIAARREGKIVFSTYDDEFTFQRLTPAMLGSRWVHWDGKLVDVAPPPPELIGKFLQTGMRNATAHCASVKTWLKSRKIKFGQRAVKAAWAGMDEKEMFSAGIYTIGLPAVSADGQTAIRYMASSFGSEASGGHAEYLRRDSNGDWAVIATFSLWIS